MIPDVGIEMMVFLLREKKTFRKAGTTFGKHVICVLSQALLLLLLIPWLSVLNKALR